MSKKTQSKKIVPPSPQKKKGESKSVFEKANSFFEKRGTIFFWLFFLLAIIFSILFFDVKMSDGGDDSSYVVRAFQFLHHFKFPGWQGPLYPIVLSLVVAVFGIKLVVLKSFSLICILVFFYLFHRTSKEKIPAVILYFTLLIISVNYFVLYFASQTYSEGFFFMIQAILFLIIYKDFITIDDKNISLKKDYKKFLLLGFWLSIVHLSKNIGLASAIAVLIYFILEKKWKTFLFTAVSFGIFYFTFDTLKNIIWHVSDSQISAEGSGLMRKDFYNPSEGNEDFAGFVQRFIDNSNLYLSRHLFVFMGLKSSYEPAPLLTVVAYALFAIAFFSVFRKNKFILFTGIYIAVMMGTTFFILQKIWDQWRLIVIYYPYILIFLAGGFYYIFNSEKLKRFQLIFLLLLGIISFTTVKGTFNAVSVTKKNLEKNLEGDMLYGMHPGLANFIRLSQWAAKNTPKDKLIASRKQDISFVYTGREFYGIYTVPRLNTDSMLNIVARDTANVYVTVQETNIFRKKGLEQLYESYRFYIKFFISSEYAPQSKEQGNVVNILYGFPKKNSEELIHYFDSNKVPYEKGIKNILDVLKKKYDKIYIYDPDHLLKILKHDNVEYAIITNIKYKNQYGKDVTSMGTVSNFLQIIELKYPILSIEHKIGKEEDFAALLKIHYERLNAAVVKL